jgi:hypothetical protein
MSDAERSLAELPRFTLAQLLLAVTAAREGLEFCIC